MAELGGNVAILDVLDKPDPEVEKLAGEFGIEARYIRWGNPIEQSGGVLRDKQNRRHQGGQLDQGI